MALTNIDSTHHMILPCHAFAHLVQLAQISFDLAAESLQAVQLVHGFPHFFRVPEINGRIVISCMYSRMKYRNSNTKYF